MELPEHRACREEILSFEMEVPSEILPFQMEGAGVKPCWKKFCNGDRNVTWHMCLAKCMTRHIPKVNSQMAKEYSVVVYVGSI